LSIGVFTVPISLNQLRERKATTTLDLGDGLSIQLVYKPNEITPGYLDSVSKETDLMALARVVARIISSWDITDDDGVAMSVTDETAAQLGIQLLNEIITTVASDMRPLAAKRNGKR
jgi:hydrogenase maturation factor